MFGTNPLRKKSNYDEYGQLVVVQNIFHTIQGEGPFAGRPAVFLRLSGCNLRCHFCDTDFESQRHALDFREVAKQVLHASKHGTTHETNLVVITGGEPLLQNIIPLLGILCNMMGFEVQIETAGTVWVDGLEKFIDAEQVTLVCSPKTGTVDKMIAEYCTNWKYLIQEGQVSPGDGLPNKSTQVPGKDLKLYRPVRRTDTIWLQPCEAYKVGYNKIDLNHLNQEQIKSVQSGELADQSITSSVRDEVQTLRNMRLCGKIAMQFNYRVSVQLHKILGLP